MRREQFHAKRVDRSEERAAKRFHGFQRQPRFENLSSCSLLHFIGGAICVGDDDELRQPFERTLLIFRDLNNAIGNRARFARAGRSYDRQIAVQLASKSLPRGFVGNGCHFASSGSANAGWVSTHLSLSNSVSIGSVASGYFATNPKSA